MSVCNIVTLRRVPEGAENLTVGGGRRRQDPQRLVGVGGDDRGVERRLVAVNGPELNVSLASAHALDWRGELNVVQALGDPLDVGPRTADHGPPLGSPADRQQTVVVEEREEVEGRIVHRRAGGARPHSRDHRDEKVRAEVVGEAVRRRERAERRAVVSGRQQLSSRSVEADDFAEHPQIVRPEIGKVGKQTAQPAPAGVLQPASLARNRHPHQAWPRLHVQLGEQTGEQRVGRFVVHDEAAVDRQCRTAAVVDVVGVGVPAEAVRPPRTA